jgi:hypothetical protein
VVEVATDTDFDGVTLHWLFTTFELEQFSARGWAGPARWQARAKDVGHFNQLFVVTDGARLTRRAPDVSGGAQQLWVRVADIFVAHQSGGNLGEQGVAHQSELNDCSVGSAGSKTLIH